jgi:hypothetical protein
MGGFDLRAMCLSFSSIIKDIRKYFAKKVGASLAN